MKEAINKLEKLSSDSRIIGLYDAEKVARKPLNTQLKSAKLDGTEEEKIERNIEIAKKLLKMHLTVEEISETTNLAIEEIENLK